MKKIGSLLLVFVLLFAASPLALADEGDLIDPEWYTPGMFTDVPEGAWYEDALADCYDSGLVNGDSETTFDPDGVVTIAQAVTFAARANDYLGSFDGSVFETTDPWYLTYARYAQENGIIAEGQFVNMEAPATRRDVAIIMASALPEDYTDSDYDFYIPLTVSSYEAVNRVDDGAIPDVPAGDPGYEAIYKLYRAGILTGGEGGAFRPDEVITRAEAVVLLDRLVFEWYRPRFMLTRDGLYNVYLGGIGLKSPAGFTVDDTYNDLVDLSVYDADGFPAVSIQILSLPHYNITQEQFEEYGQELFSSFLYIMGTEFEDGAPVIVESTFAGLPAYTFTDTYSVDVGGELGVITTSIRADLTFNALNSTLVCATFEYYQDEAGAAYLPAYESMLASAVVNESDTGGELNEDLAATMDKLAEFVPQYLEFAQRFADTLQKELPDLYDELIDQTTQLAELAAELSSLETADLSGADLMYIMTRLQELLSAIPGGEELLDGLFGEQGGI